MRRTFINGHFKPTNATQLDDRAVWIGYNSGPWRRANHRQTSLQVRDECCFMMTSAYIADYLNAETAQ